MPLPSKRMTQQPAKPTRYFPGKAYAQDQVSDDEESSESEEEQQPARPPPPKATSYPAHRKPVPDLAARRKAYLAAHAKPEVDLEGFVTASESSDDGEGDEDGSDEDSEEEDSDEKDESSSDDEPKKPMLAPKFLSKNKRTQQSAPEVSVEELAAEKDRRRKQEADELLQAQLDRDAAARAAGKKYWDDEDVAPEDEVVDTDDLDPEAEKAAWKLRELKRVQRDRAALVEKEKEREEIERRRNMTAEERDAEDKEYLAQQASERDGRGKISYLQRYHHKGAFFAGDEQDEEVQAALNRDFAGARFEDDVGDKAVLPEYMRIRDMTKLGKKGRTRYKDLRSEDTGRWGEFGGRKEEYDGLDERFRPDDRRDGGRERTGANVAPLGERRRREDDNAGRDEKRARYD